MFHLKNNQGCGTDLQVLNNISEISTTLYLKTLDQPFSDIAMVWKITLDNIPTFSPEVPDWK